MPLPWNAALLPEAPLLALARRASPAACSARTSAAPCARRGARRVPRFVPAVALAVVIACLAIPMRTDERPAAPRLRHARRSGPRQREVSATVKLDPPDAADDAKWFHAMAWQGGGSRLVQLREIAPGHLPHRRADPGRRRLEGDGPPAHGRARSWRCRSTCPATRRSRHARSRPSRTSRARSSSTTRSCAARSAASRAVAQRRRLRHPRRGRARLARSRSAPRSRASSAASARRARVTLQPPCPTCVQWGMRRMP